MATFTLDVGLRQGAFMLDVSANAEARALALFGPSGSGKTTVLEAIAGLRVPERGRISIDGHVLFDKAGRVNTPPRRRRVGYVPQDVLLFPHLDVRQNVLYGRRTTSRSDVDLLVDLLELGPLMDRRVPSLSGGERQRVAIARALYSGPEVLLLDEPLAAVDIPLRRRVVAALLGIRDRLGVPMVYVTHSPDEAMELSDHAIVLDAGRVTASGAPREVLKS